MRELGEPKGARSVAMITGAAVNLLPLSYRLSNPQSLYPHNQVPDGGKHCPLVSVLIAPHFEQHTLFTTSLNVKYFGFNLGTRSLRLREVEQLVGFAQLPTCRGRTGKQARLSPQMSSVWLLCMASLMALGLLSREGLQNMELQTFDACKREQREGENRVTFRVTALWVPSYLCPCLLGIPASLVLHTTFDFYLQSTYSNAN